MNTYQVTFYDLTTWQTEGISSLHARRLAREYYPKRFVVTVIQIK